MTKCMRSLQAITSVLATLFMRGFGRNALKKRTIIVAEKQDAQKRRLSQRASIDSNCSTALSKLAA